MTCKRVVITTGGTPPVVSSVIINGESNSITPVSAADIYLLALRLNKVINVFTVSIADDSVVVTATFDSDIVIVTDSGSYTLTEYSCNECDGCYDNLIGLKGICEDSQCLLYLNDIGIDSAFVEQVITDEHTGIESFYNSMVLTAQKDISSMIHSYMMPKYYASSVVADGKIGYLDVGYIVPLSSWYGIRIRLNGTDYNTYIRKAGVSVKYTGDVALCVFDLTTGNMTNVRVIPVVSGYTEWHEVNIKITSADMFIGYKPSGKIRTTYLSRGLCCGNHKHTCRAFSIEGAYGNLDSLNESDKTGGLFIEYSSSCDHDSWICRNGVALSVPLLYRTAMNIFQYTLTRSKHSRVNTVVSLNREAVEKSLEWVSAKFHDSMQTAMQGLSLPNNECFRCNEYARSVLSLP